MGIALLDSSALIGFLQPDDPHHRAAQAALEKCASDDLVVPAVAYAEVLVGALRRGRAAVRTVEGFLEEAVVRVEPLTEPIARLGAELRARQGKLRLADALIIATGEALGTDRILTADASWRTVSKRVLVLGAGA